MTRMTIAALAAAALLALAGCAEKDEHAKPPAAERFDVMLDYFPNADHAGIYAAIANGDFKRAGLDVHLRTPSDPAAPLKLLSAARVDLAISYEPELFLARDKGAELVSVGALVQKPLTALISLPSKGIRGPEDLADKRVGTAGIPYQSAYLRTILDAAGVAPGRVKETSVGFNLVPAMLSGKVDATLGAFWNYEGIELAQRGKRPNVIRMEAVGVPTYNELIVVARRADLAKRGGVVRRFMQALARGHAALRRDPNAAVEALLRANPDLKRKLQLAVVKATLPIFFPDEAGKPFGWQSQREWQAYADWMFERDLVERRPRAAAAFTNEFLPGEGV